MVDVSIPDGLPRPFSLRPSQYSIGSRFIQYFARGSKKEPFLGDKQKSLSRGFGFPAPSGAMREATLGDVITAPLAAELIRRRLTRPLAVDHQWFLLSPHSSRTGDRTGCCSLWPPDVLSAWSVGEPCPPGRSFPALIFFGRADVGNWEKAKISLALP